MRQIVLDTETTGIKVDDGHRVIEIGCLELINRKLTGQEFHFYINPQREIDAGAVAVHGITNDFLADKPLFESIANPFIDFISGAELIIHNAPFDVSFLNNELMLASASFKKLADYCTITDTLKIARQIHVGQRNSLDALCKRYGVDNSKRSYHGALKDAYLLAQVYLIMTGGQGSLFDSFVEETQSAFSSLSKATQNQSLAYSVPVLYADATEVLEHSKYLDKLKQQGKCLWVDVSEK